MNKLIRYGAIAIGAAMMSSCGAPPEESGEVVDDTGASGVPEAVAVYTPSSF